MCKKHPDKYVEAIKEDLRSDSFQKQVDYEYADLDDVYRIFNDPSYEDEVTRLIQDLKAEKDF